MSWWIWLILLAFLLFVFGLIVSTQAGSFAVYGDQEDLHSLRQSVAQFDRANTAGAYDPRLGADAIRTEDTIKWLEKLKVEELERIARNAEQQRWK